jgi:hypothetical protein
MMTLLPDTTYWFRCLHLDKKIVSRGGTSRNSNFVCILWVDVSPTERGLLTIGILLFVSFFESEVSLFGTGFGAFTWTGILLVEVAPAETPTLSTFLWVDIFTWVDVSPIKMGSSSSSSMLSHKPSSSLSINITGSTSLQKSASFDQGILNSFLIFQTSSISFFGFRDCTQCSTWARRSQSVMTS